ncbi:elongation factor P, partial [Candidatus Roizmanbacteria bacterium CG10_big_fil_rev_8_21_14_0_10_45_7]
QHDVLVFMDEINYEQYEVPVLLAEDIAGLLKEGQSMYVLLHEGKPIGVIPPKKVVLKVVEADDAVKGDTATNAKKSVKVETGASILVPLFIKTGDTIVINPETGEYTGREN